MPAKPVKIHEPPPGGHCVCAGTDAPLYEFVGREYPFPALRGRLEWRATGDAKAKSAAAHARRVVYHFRQARRGRVIVSMPRLIVPGATS
jgi:hypothetical protein